MSGHPCRKACKKPCWRPGSEDPEGFSRGSTGTRSRAYTGGVVYGGCRIRGVSYTGGVVYGGCRLRGVSYTGGVVYGGCRLRGLGQNPTGGSSRGTWKIRRPEAACVRPRQHGGTLRQHPSLSPTLVGAGPPGTGQHSSGIRSLLEAAQLGEFVQFKSLRPPHIETLMNRHIEDNEAAPYATVSRAPTRSRASKGSAWPRHPHLTRCTRMLLG